MLKAADRGKRSGARGRGLHLHRGGPHQFAGHPLPAIRAAAQAAHRDRRPRAHCSTAPSPPPSARPPGSPSKGNYAPEIPPFPFDAELMERVFYNLVLNAAQASPPGGAVTVKTRATDATRRSLVIDRGSGIDPKQTEAQIFNPFFTTKNEGVGLGLAIVAKIVDEHGGKIAVESEPGKGSIFCVSLPMRSSANSQPPHEETHSGSRRRRETAPRARAATDRPPASTWTRPRPRKKASSSSTAPIWCSPISSCPA